MKTIDWCGSQVPWTWKFTRWFTGCWWKYLLEKPCTWTKFRCRVKGHPEGPIYFNSGGLEPDWRCKNCGDNLG